MPCSSSSITDPLLQPHQLVNQNSPCDPCLTHCCLHWCTLCQEYREMLGRLSDNAVMPMRIGGILNLKISLLIGDIVNLKSLWLQCAGNERRRSLGPYTAFVNTIIQLLNLTVSEQLAPELDARPILDRICSTLCPSNVYLSPEL